MASIKKYLRDNNHSNNHNDNDNNSNSKEKEEEEEITRNHYSYMPHISYELMD